MYTTTSEIPEILLILLFAGITGGKSLLDIKQKWFRGGKLETTTKAQGELVTAADKGAEKIILETIAKYLEHDFNFLSEETEGVQIRDANSNDLIILDSLDGTIDFVSMQNNFGITLGLMDRTNGEVKINILIFPMTDEILIAHYQKAGVFYFKQPLETLDDIKLMLTGNSIKFHTAENNKQLEDTTGILYSAHKKNPNDTETLPWYSQYSSELATKGVVLQTIDSSCAGVKATVLLGSMATQNVGATYIGTKLWDVANTYLIAKAAGLIPFNPKTGVETSQTDFRDAIEKRIKHAATMKNTEMSFPLGVASSFNFKNTLALAYQTLNLESKNPSYNPLFIK